MSPQEAQRKREKYLAWSSGRPSLVASGEGSLGKVSYGSGPSAHQADQRSGKDSEHRQANSHHKDSADIYTLKKHIRTHGVEEAIASSTEVYSR